MSYITKYNMKKIVLNSDLKKINLGEELYKMKIYFFNKYEKNQLLAIKELLKNPEKYFTEVYTPYEPPTDTFTYVYESISPAYHNEIDCSRLNANYQNFAIPKKIIAQGSDIITAFREWFKTVEDDVFQKELKEKWGIDSELEEISNNNSGVSEIPDLTIEELEEEIDAKIKAAGRFFYENSKNTEILKRFSKYAFIGFKVEPIEGNNTSYPDKEVKELLCKYDKEYKTPLKTMLIEYYRLKFNPDIEMEGEILEKLGFKPCQQCYSISTENQEELEELFESLFNQSNDNNSEIDEADSLPF